MREGGQVVCVGGGVGGCVDVGVGGCVSVYFAYMCAFLFISMVSVCVVYIQCCMVPV